MVDENTVINWNKFFKPHSYPDYQTEEMCLEAIRRTPSVYYYIQRPSLTVLKQLIRSGIALNNFNHKLNHLNFNELNELYEFAIWAHPANFNDLGNPTYKQTQWAVKYQAEKCWYKIIRELPHHVDEDLFIQLVRAKPGCVKFMRIQDSYLLTKFMTKELALEILEQSFEKRIYDAFPEFIQNDEEFQKEFKRLKLKNGLKYNDYINGEFIYQ